MPRQDMIRARRGTAAEWALSTDILYSGELAWASDTNEFKLGDGFNTFSALPSVSASDAAVAAFVTGGGPTETALNTTNVQVENVKKHGATGDGVTVDTAAIQAAIDAAAGGGVVYFPPGIYISGALTSTAKLTLRGAGAELVSLTAIPGFTGTLVTPSTTFDIADITFSGRNLDGAYALGNTTGNFGGTSVQRVKFYEWDYAIRFTGSCEFPLRSVWNELYMFGVRSAGILIATGGAEGSGLSNTPASGQSGWTFDNIVITNGGSASYVTSAPSLSVTHDATPTTDTLTWSSAGASEFGWIVMRKPQGSTNVADWRHVAYALRTATGYTATKVAPDLYDYAVVRNSHGVYLRHGKAIDIGVIQAEYVGVGLALTVTRGVTVEAFYSEWRGGSLTTPTPRGDGIIVTQALGTNLETGWLEGNYSGVLNQASIGTRIGELVVTNAQRSVVQHNANGENQSLEVGAVHASSGTPALVTTDESAYSANWVIRESSTASNRLRIGHTTLSEFVAEYRGNRRAAIGGDITSGYLDLGTGALPAASATFEGQVRRVNGLIYICYNDGIGYAWVELVKKTRVSNSAVQFLEGKRSDASAVGSFGYDGSGQPTMTPSSSTKDVLVTTGGVRLGAAGPMWRAGSGSPESVVTAPVGSLYTRTDGGAATSLYVKETGAGNTGWVAK